MKSLLEALKEGRIVELPESHDKEASLEFLAHIIEAVPDIGSTVDLMQSVSEREAQANTGIGRGVACPHCRVATQGELLCAVGWSPKGIEYGSADGKHVHLVIMYYVPDAQRNAYLKEISGLAKAVSAGDSIETIAGLSDITNVRDKLLDWVALAISEALPESKARMIKLEAKQATAAALAAAPAAGTTSVSATELARARLLPFRLIAWPGSALVLSADPALAEALEKIEGLAERLRAGGEIEAPGWRIVVMSETPFARDRREFEAVALKLG
jgi:nitrogen PTS system EIIA component